MNKNDILENNVDESIEVPFKPSYCKDLTSILTNKASDHSRTLKVTVELKREGLILEDAHIDEKIATILKRNEKSQQEAQDLDRQLYKATEVKNQAMNRFKRTGEMINVLKDEAEKIKEHSKKIEIRRLEVTKTVEELTARKQRNEELKKQIENLEGDIKNVVDAPEPKLNQTLFMENIELKNKVAGKLQTLNNKRMKKIKMENWKDEKLKLLQEINEKQERNKAITKVVDKKKEEFREKEKIMREKLDTMQERLIKDMEKRETLLDDWKKYAPPSEALPFLGLIKDMEKRETLLDDLKKYAPPSEALPFLGLIKDTEKRDTLLDDLKKYVENTEEMRKKIEGTKENVAKKEEELETLKTKIEIEKSHVQDENDKKKKEYESETEKLRIAVQKLQEILSENDRFMKIISEKSEHLTNLKEKKGDLLVLLCDKKTQLVMRQHQNSDQQTRIDILSEKLDVEARHVDELEAKQRDLDAKFESVKKAMEEFPLELEARKQTITTCHWEKMEGLMKQQNFQKATIEFLQLRLDGNLKKIEILKKEIQDHDETIKWDQMRYELRQKTAEKLQERAAKEQASYEILAAQLKQKEADVKTAQAGAVLADRKPTATLKNKSPLKENVRLEETDTVENEEEDKSQSGRKSPGILKSPFKQPNQQLNKRVTFEGLSSTESSSISLKSPPDGAAKNLEDESMDELLQEWAGANYSSAGRRRQLDF